jgi:hypothetical protein
MLTLSVADYIYLKEMAIQAGKIKKFRGRLRGPFQVINDFQIGTIKYG